MIYAICLGAFIAIFKSCFNKLLIYHAHLELDDIDRLMQERRNSIANALELRLSCINPSI